jgi:hypothetical protein
MGLINVFESAEDFSLAEIGEVNDFGFSRAVELPDTVFFSAGRALVAEDKFLEADPGFVFIDVVVVPVAGLEDVVTAVSLEAILVDSTFELLVVVVVFGVTTLGVVAVVFVEGFVFFSYGFYISFFMGSGLTGLVLIKAFFYRFGIFVSFLLILLCVNSILMIIINYFF